MEVLAHVALTYFSLVTSDAEFSQIYIGCFFNFLRNVYADTAHFKNQVVLLLLSCFFLKYLGNGQCHL